ncbi:MAG: beta-galactosidase [Nitrosopumilus sp.]|nr:beta-galactosidase [Nitrosopumilus sp.]MDH3486732.1 beta-galactosidase [Nitrosopumilus sp.]
MDKKILAIIASIVVIIAIASAFLAISNSEIMTQKTNEKIGLVINSPSQSITLQNLDQIYSEAASSGIGRSNVYVFWNLVEPVRGEFDWQQSDALMSFNKKNNLKVTLYFSVINGETLGPFPSWIGKPPIISIGEDRVVSVLDAILSRYDIIDTVILSGETESQFRFNEQNITVYKDLFNGVYEKTKEKHPDIKIGNAFALHQVINKNLQYIVTDLAIGDFIAFSYSPVNTLNDIVKTPQQAKEDLQQVFDLAGDKKVGIFELSWSTSDFVGGSDSAQTEFLEKSFEFYTENESDLEFFTWYRQYDKPEGTCIFEEQEIGEDSLTVGGSGFGSSEYVIERLNQYVCNAGLINSDGTPKSGWNEFKKQIEMTN